MKNFFSLLLLNLIVLATFAQSPNCAGMTMICLDNQVTFPLYGDGTGSGQGPQAETGPNYNCLMTTPSPTWFYFRVKYDGNISINISSTTNNDLDFVCWGPFSDDYNFCHNLNNSTVDCSYSTSPIENCDIPLALSSQYYVLMVTNYSNFPGVAQLSLLSQNNELDCYVDNMPITSNSPLCDGDSLKLSTINYNYGITYNWSGPCGFNAVGSIVSIPNVSNYCEGFYKLSTFYGSHLIAMDSVFIEINPYPQVNITSSYTDTICAGTYVTLTPSGATSYSWNNFPGVYYYLYKEVFSTQEFKVIGFNNTCTDTASITVIVKGNPLTISPGDTTVCYQNPFQLHASGGYNYYWYPSIQLSDSVGDLTTMTPVTSSYINVTYLDTVNNCDVHSDVFVNIENPMHNINYIQGPDNVCPGNSFLYEVNPSNIVGNFRWYLLNGDSTTTNVPKLLYNVDFGENTGYLKVRSYNSCPIFDTASIKIIVKDYSPRPQIDIIGDTNICLGESTFLGTSQIFDRYYWSSNDTTSLISITNSGYYYFAVADSNFCRSPVSDTVRIFVTTMTPTVIVLIGNYLHSLVPHGNNWYRNGIFTGDTNTDLYYNQSGNYFSVLSSNGCLSTRSNIININPADITELKEPVNSIEIYPNPTTDEITIEFLETLGKVNISLYSPDGRLLLNRMIESGSKQELSLEQFSRGIYHLTITGENKISNFNIIKL